ncbi:MAG: hypothetical protein WCI88_10165 [Chloroflexota bacterium]
MVTFDASKVPADSGEKVQVQNTACAGMNLIPDLPPTQAAAHGTDGV